MSNPIAPAAAEAMVAGWAEALGVKPENPEALVRAVEAGRLDWSGDSFLYLLAAPVKLENSTMLESITISEPTCAQLRDAAKGKAGDMDTAIRLISSLSSQPVGVIERIKQRDFTLLAELVGFFG